MWEPRSFGESSEVLRRREFGMQLTGLGIVHVGCGSGGQRAVRDAGDDPQRDRLGKRTAERGEEVEGVPSRLRERLMWPFRLKRGEEIEETCFYYGHLFSHDSWDGRLGRMALAR